MSAKTINIGKNKIIGMAAKTKNQALYKKRSK
jgi:hypothetical protein